MSPRNADPELRALVDAAIDGSISDADHDRLAELLDADEDAREYYTDMAQMHAALLWEHAEPLEQPADAPHARVYAADEDGAYAGPHATTEPVATLRPMLRWAIAAGVAIVAGLMTAMLLPHGGTHGTTPGGAPQIARGVNDGRPIAVLADAEGAVWAEDSVVDPQAGIGQSLAAGTLRLKSGAAQVVFNNGAVVRMSGPTQLVMSGPDRCRLTGGRMVVRVPHRAKGFVVDAPNLVVTDLGTAFGVTVDERGAAEVHVFEGHVRTDVIGADGHTVRSMTLSEDHAVRFEGGTNLVQRVADRSAFGVTGVPPHRTAYEQTVLDDKPLAYWPLTDRAMSDGTVYDLSGHEYHGQTRGTVAWSRAAPTGPRTLTTGRDGYVEIGREKAFNLTNGFAVEAWVWLDYEMTYGRIISADSNGPTAGWGLAYQGPKRLTDDGSIFFTTYSILDFRFAATVPMQKWAHLVVVFDANDDAHLYINGVLKQTIASDRPAKTGDLNVVIGRMSHGIQNWYGALAHVAVYDHELAAERVAAHYRTGAPDVSGNGGAR
ncbi:MAG: hypothetical protein GC159_05380 [Phycisphaera sp.]|nr:hypothetical protein [Phycisphaera sp.]